MILGLDLSLRASAAIACPLDWDGEWRHLRPLVVGERLAKGATEAERIGRCQRIAGRLTCFARATGVGVAFLEGYAYGQATAAHSLGELGGIVRSGLLDLGVALHVASMATARKLMCGRIPRGTAPKEAVLATLAGAGAPEWLLASHDLADAFVALNYGLAELGGYCFAREAA